MEVWRECQWELEGDVKKDIGKKKFNSTNEGVSMIGVNLNKGGDRMSCPFQDYKGNHIVDGDKMTHPDGEEFVVKFDPNRQGSAKWRAVYKDKMNLWLGNQVTKGQAVVIKSE